MQPYTCTHPSAVGLLTLSSDGEHITGLWIEGQKYFAATLPAQHQSATLPVFDQCKRWLDNYFSGEQPPMDIPLAPQGSPFRQAVWQLLLQIPYGEVMTYGQIAQRMEEQTQKHMSAQAVGGAVGHNPISLLIPCHRVLGSGGSLTGYAGGVAVKERLLRLEGHDTSRFSVPTTGSAL